MQIGLQHLTIAQLSIDELKTLRAIVNLKCELEETKEKFRVSGFGYRFTYLESFNKATTRKLMQVENSAEDLPGNFPPGSAAEIKAALQWECEQLKADVVSFIGQCAEEKELMEKLGPIFKQGPSEYHDEYIKRLRGLEVK